MLEQIKKSYLLLFTLIFFGLNAKINFTKSELSPVLEKKITLGLKKVVRQFNSEARKTKEQFLNMIIIAFIGNDIMESLMNADEKTKTDFENKFQSFMRNLTPETLALQQMIGDVFNTIITKEMEKGKEGYFGSIDMTKDAFDQEFAKLSVTYQLIVYDELYNTLTPNEQQSFCDLLLLTNQNKKNVTKKNLPKPEELHSLLQQTIERTLKFMSEFAEQMAEAQNQADSVNE